MQKVVRTFFTETYEMYNNVFTYFTSCYRYSLNLLIILPDILLKYLLFEFVYNGIHQMLYLIYAVCYEIEII